MRVVPINVCRNSYSNFRNNTCNPEPCSSQVSFRKGRECTRMLGAFFGFVGAAWAVAKTTAVTGEVDFNTTLAYSIIGTALGALLGNKIDNDVDNNEGFNKTA